MAAAAQAGVSLEGVIAGIPLPTTLRLPVAMNDAELLEFASRNPLYRIERKATGELEIMTPVGGDGSRWEALVIAELTLWAEEHGGVCFSSSGGFSLSDGSMLSPDAAWISEARWSELTEHQRRSFPPICPEFVIEMLSASDSLPALEAKMRVWLDNGAKLAWLLDPRAGRASIYRAGEQLQVLDRPDWVEAGDPVAGFRLRTARFWTR